MNVTVLSVRRPPWLTAAVFVPTAAMALAQLAVPSLLERLERTPSALHGEPWRLATALLVQDGGVIGALSNLAFLAVIGAVAEQVLPRPRWVLHYAGVGLVAGLVATAWQPVGGGNSIAICGLTAALVLAAWRGDPSLPEPAPQALLIWCGALLGTLSDVVAGPAIAVAVGAALLARRRRERREPVLRPTAAAVVATGLVLAVAANIHGAALLAGTALGILTVGPPWSG
jgi:membrane associated rhomboid family serine protease